ncbi:MAG TPA: hypothetical protein VHE35_36395 [Kofleriaceae bacterium]|nr:hypothetical protein [Kofleriaceae bacterium]
MRQHAFISTAAVSAVSALGLAGCLSAPSGRAADASLVDAAVDAPAVDAPIDAPPMDWPPAGTSVLAVAAGPVDGDNVDDLVVLDGTSHAIYLLQGGTDVDPTRRVVDATASVADHYSRMVTQPNLGAPAAVLTVMSGDVRLVVLDTPTDGSAERVTMYDGNLVKTGETTIPAPPPMPTDRVGLQKSTFGMGMSSVFIETPQQVGFLENADLATTSPQVKIVGPGTEPHALVPPTHVLAAGGYPPAMPQTDQPQVFISEAQISQRADANMGVFTWTTIRGPDAPTVWRDQVVADVSGDTRPEIVAYEEVAGDKPNICALDVDSTNHDTGCLSLSTAVGPLSSTAMSIGPVVAQGQQDVVVYDLVGPGSVTGVFVMKNVQLSGSTLTSDGVSQPRQLMLTRPMSFALGQLDSEGLEILGVGKDGKVRCLKYNGTGTPLDCAP